MKIKNTLLYIILGGLFAITFIPFIVPQAMFFPFITGKGFAFRILVEIIFSLFVILAFIDKNYRPKMSWMTKAIGFFVLAILISDLLGANPYKSLWSNYERMEGFVLLIHLFMYYLVVSSVFKTISLWNRFFNVSILASVTMSFYGLLQLIGKLTINQGGVRLDGTFGNASYFAIYLVFHIFLCLYMLVDRTKKQWLRWLYGLVAIFETCILYFTATRGAILGLLGGLIFTGILVAWKEKENLYLRRIAYGLLGGMLFIIIVFMAMRGTSFVQNNPILSRFASLSSTEFKTQGRYFVWPMAIKGFLERPIFGWGQESFNFVFNKYYDPRMYSQEQWFDRTHDVVLDWLIAGGIIGLLSYASIYLVLFYYIWRKESPLKLAEKSILTGMVSAYIFHNIFVFDNLISYILFFSILAYIHSVSTIGHEGKGEFFTKTFSNDILNYAVLSGILILTVALVYFVNVPAIRANQTLIQAISPQKEGAEKNLSLFKQVYGYNSFGYSETTEQLVEISTQIISATIPDNLKQEFISFAQNKIEEKVSQTPTDARYLVFAGSFFNRVSKYDEAIKYLDRAVKESPRKQSIYFELGTSYLGKQDYVKTFELFKKAYELATSSPESRIIYAIGALYTKNVEVLKEMSKVIDKETVLYDNRFLKAYADIGDYTTVISILNTRLEREPTNMQYKLSLASSYATIGQKQKAVSIIREMIVQEPNFKEQGEIYIKQIQGI